MRPRTYGAASPPIRYAGIIDEGAMDSGIASDAVRTGRANLLYRHLPPVQQERWNHLLKPVRLRAGECLFESRAKVRQVYLPISSVISLLGITRDGDSALLATVGYEGMVGLPALFGGESNVRAMVQNEGIALRLEASELVRDFHHDDAVRRHLLRYMQVFFMQLSQGALCNRHHKPEQQLCTLILRTLDRRRTNELRHTHETLAHVLGWRRETVSHAAHKLQRCGLLHYSRGQITVLNRPALEGVACECYQFIQQCYARLWYAPGEPLGAQEPALAPG